MARWRPLTENEKRQIKMKAKHAVEGMTRPFHSTKRRERGEKRN